MNHHHQHGDDPAELSSAAEWRRVLGLPAAGMVLGWLLQQLGIF